jgi:hypothetical protein
MTVLGADQLKMARRTTLSKTCRRAEGSLGICWSLIKVGSCSIMLGGPRHAHYHQSYSVVAF